MRSFLALLFTLSLASAQETTRLRDVIYQKRDGFALTLDVFTPAKPNGAAMIKIVSGGWNSNHNGIGDGGWTKSGYTTFVVVHGSQPRFHIDEIVTDVQRAVRFVRATAATSTSAWGEVSYRDLSQLPRFNPGIDISPLPGMDPANRLGVIVASERLAVRDNLPFSVRGGRLVAFGSGDLPVNNRIVNAGNLNIFLNAVNWTVDRDTQLNVPARPIERFQLSLSADVFLKLRYALLFVLPGLAAVLGLAVYWARRR